MHKKRDARKRDAKRRRRSRCKRLKRPKQTGFCWRTHGGQRRGAGRKPAGRRAGVPHRCRGTIWPTRPVHVGLKVAADVSNLRHPDLFGPLSEAIYAGSERFGMRIIHFSVIEDHLHFIVEAEGVEALARGMQGLAVRLAKRINKVLGRRGKVFVDRYFSRVLSTPSEVRSCLSYVLKNKLRHNKQRGIVHGSRWVDYCSSGERFSGWKGIEVTLPDDALSIGRPSCHLLRRGWKYPRGEYAGELEVDKAPGDSKRRRPGAS
jgi:REP element-mobilizing transposase RayT